jgi:hypothetical protein
MPDMSTLMAQFGLETDWFNDRHEMWLRAYVRTGNGQEVLACPTEKSCRIRPSWGWTPIWYGMSPPVLYPGQLATMIVNPAKAPAHQFVSTFIHMIDIKLDDIELDINPFVDEE